jgi:hypothetical protein
MSINFAPQLRTQVIISSFQGSQKYTVASFEVIWHKP